MKTVHHDGDFWRGVKAAYPELLLIGRKFCKHQDLEDPEQEAANLVRWIMDSSVTNVYSAWEGFNEIPVGKLGRVCRFDIAMAELLHREGLKYVAGSWSVGVPDIPDWMRWEMQQALRVADYIGVHEYCAPRMDDPRGLDAGNPGTGWFTLRWKKWYPLLPTDCQKPVIISECGIDSGAAHWNPGAQGGWRSFTNAQGYLQQLRWYDAYLQSDPHVAGAAIFCHGTLDPTWDTFDVSGEMLDLLGDYLREDPGPPPTPPPPDDHDELWEAIAAIGVRAASNTNTIDELERRLRDARLEF